MNSNITLGEVRDTCIQRTGKYGDNCCRDCPYSDMGCCDAPDSWKLEVVPHIDWEKACHEAEEHVTKLLNELAERAEYARRVEEKNERLRTIVSVVETMIGRRFDV